MAELRQDSRPAAGAIVFFQHWSHEWLPAEVVTQVKSDDNDGIAGRIAPAHAGTVHLRLTLDPDRHHSADTFAYRTHVERGVGVGQWLPEPPKDWEARMVEFQTREQLRKEERLAAWAEQAGAEPNKAGDVPARANA